MLKFKLNLSDIQAAYKKIGFKPNDPKWTGYTYSRNSGQCCPLAALATTYGFGIFGMDKYSSPANDMVKFLAQVYKVNEEDLWDFIRAYDGTEYDLYNPNGPYVELGRECRQWARHVHSHTAFFLTGQVY